jgi:hypothetical protein
MPSVICEKRASFPTLKRSSRNKFASGSTNTFYRLQTAPLPQEKESNILVQRHGARALGPNQRLVAILKIHGVAVRTIKAKRVGYVVYEHEFQIVAEPFSGEKY